MGSPSLTLAPHLRVIYDRANEQAPGAAEADDPWVRVCTKLDRLGASRPELVTMVGNAVEQLLDRWLEASASAGDQQA